MKKKNNIFSSFQNAFCGIFSALKNERNLKIHFSIMFLVVIFGFILKISKVEWIVCLCLFALVISFELVNTSIEKTVDLITEEKNEKAKFAKDVSAGAVLFCAIISALIGLIIFIPKIIALF